MLEGHQAGVTCVTYNANGNLLASCSADKSFRVWDAKQFQQVWKSVGHEGQGSIRAVMDGEGRGWNWGGGGFGLTESWY